MSESKEDKSLESSPSRKSEMRVPLPPLSAGGSASEGTLDSAHGLPSAEVRHLFDEAATGKAQNLAPEDLEVEMVPILEDAELISEPELSEAVSREVNFYRKEARALAERQPERAALMWIEAACAAERGGATLETIQQDLDEALKLLPQSPWLMNRARRLLVRLRSYEKAIKLGQREAKLGGDMAGRVALLLEAAGIVRYHLKNARVALQILNQALDVQPHYVPALLGIVTLCQELGMDAEACAAMERLADCLTHPGQRAVCLFSAATFHEWRLGNLSGAEAAYRRALEADPQNILASHALAETYRTAEQWPELCRALEHLADLVPDLPSRGELLLEAGVIHLDRTGDLAAATRVLGRAVRAVPDNLEALELLAHAYEMEGRNGEAAETLCQLVAITPDALRKATLLTQLGSMQANLNQLDLAAASYRQALELIPGYLPALQEFGTLCQKRGDFEALVALGRQESESLLPPGARAVRYLELADILDRELGRPEEAADAYRRAIELDPELHLGYWFLASLLRRHGWHTQLIQVLRQQASICQDPRSRAHLLVELARLQSDTLGDPRTAIEVLNEAGDQAAPASVLFQLAELYAGLGRHAELVELLLRHAAQTTDKKEAEGRRVWAALVLEKQLGERDRALVILREVLSQNPKSHAAIHGIGRILHWQGAWEELVKLYHHELTVEPDRPDTAVMLCRMARIIEERIGNASAAIGAYAKALRHDPSYAPALRPFEKLVRQQAKWPKVVEMFQAFAEATRDDRLATAALSRAGQVALRQLAQPELAEDLCRKAWERSPDCDAALHGLIRVQIQRKDWTNAARNLGLLVQRMPEGEKRSLLELQLGRIKEFKLGEAPDLELYLKLMRGPFGGLLHAELLRVIRIHSAEELPAELVRAADQCPDNLLASAYLLDAAAIEEFASERPASSLLQTVRRAYERHADAAAAAAFERALVRAGQWEDLARLAEKQAELELDRNVRVQDLATAAQAFWKAGLTEEADRVCRMCLNFDAHCLPALRALAAVAESREDWGQAAELRDRLVEACADAENRLEGCLSAADKWLQKVGDSTRALASLSVALSDNPEQAEAWTRAQALLVERKDFAELSRLYQRRIRACQDKEILADLYWGHAQLLHNDLQRPERALAEISDLLRLQPDNIAALSMMADLHEQLGHWSDAASTLEVIAGKTDRPSVRNSARLRLARLLVDRLHDPKRARAVLEQTSAEPGSEVELVRLRVRLATMVGEWQDAREILEQALATSEGHTRLWCLLERVEVVSTGLRQPELARQLAVEALEYAAAQPEALQELRARQLCGPADTQRLVEMAEEALREGALQNADALRRVLVQLLLEDLQDPARALAHIDKMQAVSPAPRGVTLLRARALQRAGNRAEALRHFRALLEEDVRCPEAYRALMETGPGPLAASAASLARLMGDTLEEQASALIRRLQSLAGPMGAFPPEFRDCSEAERQLDQLLQFLMPAIVQIYPVSGAAALSPSHPVAEVAARLGRALGEHELAVRVESGRSRVGVSFGRPIIIELGADQAVDPASPVFRAAAGYAIAMGPIGALEQLDLEQRQDLLDALSSTRPSLPGGQRLRKTLLSQLSRQDRKELDQRTLGPSFDVEAIFRARRQRAGRAAVVLSLDPGIAVQTVARTRGLPALDPAAPELAPLVRFAVSDDFARIFRSVWGESF